MKYTVAHLPVAPQRDPPEGDNVHLYRHGTAAFCHCQTLIGKK